ncbi:MAG: magnesium and cobalt transport protein CorA [Actinomycetota bacterium]
MISGRAYRRGSLDPDPVEPSAAATFAGDGEWCWFDVVDPTTADLQTLQRELGLHPLAAEDARHRQQRPKVELFDDHAFVVLRPLTVTSSGDIAETEVHAFVSATWIVTLRFTPAFDLEPVVHRWEASGGTVAGGSTGYALYVLVDEVADGYLSVVERLEDRADDLEDLVFGREAISGDEQRALQTRILRLRRDVVRLRRFAMPLRQALDLVHEEPWLVGGELLPYYRDVSEHLLRSVELADNVRESLTTILEVRTAQAANQLNETTKRLTAWAGIVLVPTLIAGIYGMNFDHMPELGWQVGYPLALGLMVGSAVLLYVVFKRNDWL